MSLFARIKGERPEPERDPVDPRRLAAYAQPSLSRAIARAGGADAAPALVVRQPVYDTRLGVEAYELLFGGTGPADAGASATTLIATLADIGLEALVGERLALVAVSPAFVLQGMADLLPAGRVALQLPHAEAARDDLAAALGALAAAGHHIAIDDFVVREDTLALLELAAMVKIDVREASDDQLAAQVELARGRGARLLARGLEDRGAFERCRRLGFDLFQGELLAPASTVTGRAIPADRANQIELMAALQDPATRLEDLDAVISRDLGVSLRLLRWINSAAFALPRRVTSVHDAVVLLGERNVRNWALLVTLARDDGQPSELIRTGLVRARMCEEIAQRRGLPAPEAYFTVGLFSVVDALMSMRMEDVLAELPLTEEVQAALLRGEGSLGEVLAAVRDYERGSFERLATGDLVLRASYLAAVRWADASAGPITRAAA
jgi:c-di-GMP phosphodiesterase